MDIINYLKNNIESPKGFIGHLPLEIITLETGYMKARLKASPENANPFGTVHGGLYFAVADTVAGTAAMTHGRYVTTTSGHIHYLNGSRAENDLIVETSEIKAGQSLLTYEVNFYTEDQILVCKATLEYYALKDITL
ncbi:MAG: PaaI family thioesterase [Lachnospiraceae bacterium]|nr:PaaI family thioesterase [Lachnospiraceae bacterium]